jgi:hypothetical protein
MTGVDFRNGKFQMFHSVFAKGQFKRNPLRRHISVEMEVDKVDRNRRSTKVNNAINKWKDPVVRDGSLDEGGFEINTNPCNGDMFLTHIKELCDGLADIKAGCSTSCGMHVHINVKGTPLVKDDGTVITNSQGDMVYDQRSAYTHYDLRRLVMLYYRVEQAMFGLVNPVRLESRYSRPCGRFYLTKQTNPKDFRKEQLSKMYRDGAKLPENTRGKDKKKLPVKKVRKLIRYDETGAPVYAMVPERKKSEEYRKIGAALAKTKSHKYEDVRYKALNLHSFFMRGTVEFRHKEGTTDYNEIVNWALICGHVVEAASKMSEQQIRQLPRDSREALLAILPRELQEYAKTKWEQQDNEMPRFKQMIQDAFAHQSLDTND